MDFDKIKSTWQDSFKEEGLNDEQIRARLKLKARTEPVLNRIMKNYRYHQFALMFMYILLLTGLFIFMRSNLQYLFAFIFSVLFLLAFSWSWRQLRKIKQANTTDESVKAGVKVTIEIMERALRFGMGNIYKYLLIPLALVAGIILGIFIGAGERTFMETLYNLETGSIIKIVLVIVIGTAVTIPISQLMMKEMYKRHLDELKSCLQELEETIIN